MDKEKVFNDSGIKEWIQTINDEERKKLIVNDFYDNDFVDFFGDALKTYSFEKDKGICGILLPNGLFLKCHDKQHNLLSSLCNQEELFLSIYFSSKLNKNDESVFSHHVHNSNYDTSLLKDRVLLKYKLENVNKTIVTNEQLLFIENNFAYLNNSQRKLLLTSFFNKYEKTKEFNLKNINTKRYCIIDI